MRKSIVPVDTIDFRLRVVRKVFSGIRPLSFHFCGFHSPKFYSYKRSTIISQDLSLKIRPHNSERRYFHYRFKWESSLREIQRPSEKRIKQDTHALCSHVRRYPTSIPRRARACMQQQEKCTAVNSRAIGEVSPARESPSRISKVSAGVYIRGYQGSRRAFARHAFCRLAM